MAARVEITARYARGYVRASKKDRGELLDEVVAVTGWSRDDARRRLVAASMTRPGKGRELAGDEVEGEAGFFEGDTVAHCGPTLRGEFARTLNLTDVHTGWVFTRAVPNNAHAHILEALKTAVEEVPFAVTGLDFDNGAGTLT